MKVHIHGLMKLSTKQKSKIISALEMGFPLIDTDGWEKKILNLKMTEMNGMTNAELVSFIKKGGDGGPQDWDIDIDITGYYSYRNVVGYTYLNSIKTYINRRYLDRYTEAEVFGHIVHEMLHRLGLTHNKKHATSAVYQIGYASRDYFKEYYSLKGGPEVEALWTVKALGPKEHQSIRFVIDS